MKKLLTILALLATQVGFAACDKTVIIKESDLPEKSRTFLKTHFSGVAITSIVKEIDDFKKDYTVHLQNGFEVDFRGSGEWDEVDGRTNAMPTSVLALLPAKVMPYINENFPDHQIVKINREHFGYDIEISGGIELEFTLAGDFFNYDD